MMKKTAVLLLALNLGFILSSCPAVGDARNSSAEDGSEDAGIFARAAIRRQP